MKTSENKSAKRRYNTPEIVCVELDNQIALALESLPIGPGEDAFLNPELTINDPFLTLD